MTYPQDQDRFTDRDGKPTHDGGYYPGAYGWWNGSGDNLENYNVFQLQRFAPTYNMEADYNTNAKSYYDYLARFNGFLDTMINTINDLLRRQVTVKESNNVRMERHGDWYNKDDVEELEAFVKLSKQVIDNHKNGLLDLDDGIFVKDWTDDINQLYKDIDDLNKRIDALNDKLEKYYKELKDDINNINNRLDKLQKATFNPDMPFTINGKFSGSWHFNGGPNPDFSIHYALVDSHGGDNYDWVRWSFGFNWCDGTIGDGVCGTIDLSGTPLAGKNLAMGSGAWIYSGNVVHTSTQSVIPFFNITQDGNILTVKWIGSTGTSINSNEAININAGASTQMYAYIG